MARKLFVVAGHGGLDTGAAYQNFIEKDLTIQFRDLVIKELQINGTNVQTDSNTNALKQTLAWLKGKFGSKDILLDIHWNAGPVAANGTEVFVPSLASAFENQLANSILSVFSNAGFKARGVKPETVSARKKLGWMRPNAENVLLEVCFITNSNDMKLYEEKKHILASNLAKVLTDYSKI